MNYKQEVAGIMISILAVPTLLVLCLTFANDLGRESARIEILEQCQSNQIVTINDIEINCGVVSPVVNIKAAKYRAVKNCVKLIEGWINE
tara:strand:- start:6661 stop:6930 length:270 start_codon:yes stop_codon:yes gene_type:complete